MLCRISGITLPRHRYTNWWWCVCCLKCRASELYNYTRTQRGSPKFYVSVDCYSSRFVPSSPAVQLSKNLRHANNNEVSLLAAQSSRRCQSSARRSMRSTTSEIPERTRFRPTHTGRHTAQSSPQNVEQPVGAKLNYTLTAFQNDLDFLLGGCWEWSKFRLLRLWARNSLHDVGWDSHLMH